jgi:hypothetical protein
MISDDMTQISQTEDYTHFHQAILAPAQALLADQTQERKEEVWNAVTEAVTKYVDNVDNTGSVKLYNEVVCFSGTK